MTAVIVYATTIIVALYLGWTSYGMDLVRRETRTDDAIMKYGVTGAGITIAILDRGIDWRQPDFIKPDGTTRIKWLLDMTGQNLCDPMGPRPVEYTEDDINAALAGGPTINSRDAVGHGTVTTGIAAGNGRAFADGKYRGMAPDADLIIVKLTSEGALAHDGQPAEIPFQGCIEQALDWLDEKIDRLEQPAVALINSGTQWGPIDGTSAVSRKIDEVFGLDRPGRVYVAAAGDEGSLNNHAGGSYDNTADTIVRLNKANTQTVYLSMWYTGNQPAQVTVTFDDGATVGPVGPGGFLDRDGVYIIQYQPGQEFYPWQSTSGDRALWMRITGHSGGGSVRMRGTQPGTGRFDLYGDVSGPNLTSIVTFNDHLVPGRLTDYAATQSAVVAGNYVMRTSYRDLDGIARTISNEGAVGELWTKSSGGPTRDGRLQGVTVTAPGQNIFAAFAQNSYWRTLRFNLIEDGGGWYGRAGGTSGSAPIVVGAVALMLQLHPELTAGDVWQILSDTAVADDFTGPTPNADWGSGKLDVLQALDAVAQLIM
jgi:subtilisin family serine protease